MVENKYFALLDVVTLGDGKAVALQSKKFTYEIGDTNTKWSSVNSSASGLLSGQWKTPSVGRNCIKFKKGELICLRIIHKFI